MRILVANANTTEAITAACVASATAAAARGTRIVGGTPGFGAAVIGTRVENVIAGHALLELLARHVGKVDAVILAVSHDTALEAARQMMPCPVVGMTEAACLTACMLGGSFGVLTLGQAKPYAELVARHGLAARCADVRGVDATPQDALRDPTGVQDLVLAAAQDMAKTCDAVVLAGAVLAGWDKLLRDRCAVPLLDGMACAVKLAEMLVGLALPKPASGSYAAPTGRVTSGLSPVLASLLKGG